jgi:hypothetical protein
MVTKRTEDLKFRQKPFSEKDERNVKNSVKSNIQDEALLRGRMIRGERDEIEKRVRRQKMIIVGTGIIVAIVYMVMAYLFKDLRFPLPTPFP